MCFCPAKETSDLMSVNKLAMRLIAPRYRLLSEKMFALEKQLDHLEVAFAPSSLIIAGGAPKG